MVSPVPRSASDSAHDRPAVDARLVAPDTRYEIIDGRLDYVAPAEEPHGSRHSKVSALLEAHAADDYDVASDMLTRTSETSDFAPDVSVFPKARDPKTGGRQLEELAFEVVSTQTLGKASRKAEKLVARGVRRVFAIDAVRLRAFEWSPELGTWQLLDPGAHIEDRALAAPLPVSALTLSAKADDAMSRALLAKNNPVLQAELSEGRARGKLEGKIEALLELLAERFGPPPDHVTHRVRNGTADDVDRWLRQILKVDSLDELIEL